MLWGALSSAPCISTFLFAMGIAGRIADGRRETHYFTTKGHKTCLGAACYRGAFGWFFVIAVAGMLCMVAVVVVRRPRRSRISAV
jgi:hypothetical protein